MRSTVLLASFALACAGERGTLQVPGAAPGSPSTPGVGDDTAPQVCANPIARTEPPHGAEQVSLGAPLAVVLAEPEDDVDLRVRQDGLDVVGSVRVEAGGRMHAFTPLEPLRADSVLEGVVSWSCGTEVFRWRTAATTLAVDLSSGRVAGDASKVPLPEVLDPLLLRVEALGGGAVELIAAAGQRIGSTTSQYNCAPTTRLSGVLAGDGLFTLRAPSLTLGVSGLPVEVRGVALRGRLVPDATQASGVELSFVGDARQLARLVYGAGTEPAEVCDDVFGGCQRCADGAETCFDVRLQSVRVDQIPALVTPRTADEIPDLPRCD